MKHVFDLEISFPSEEIVDAIVSSFNPELNSAHEKNAKTTLQKVKNASMHLHIQASEKSSLRASVLNATQFLDLAITLIESN